MKKYFLVVLTAFLFFWQTLAFAESPANSLTMLLGIIQTLQAHFHQKISDNKGKLLEESQGVMSLQRGGKFRWDVSKPNKQLIVTNGTRLWIYDPDLAQVTIRNFTREVGATPALLLSDPNLALVKDFSVALIPGHADRLQWFLLTPKTSDSMFASIKLGFDTQFQINRMVLEDHLGHTTAVVFNQVEVNRPLSTALFNFKIPMNVDVIDETHK